MKTGNYHLEASLGKLKEWKIARAKFHNDVAVFLAQLRTDDLHYFAKNYAVLDGELVNLVAGGEEINFEIHSALSATGATAATLSSEVNELMVSIFRDDLYRRNPQWDELESILSDVIRGIRSEATRKGVRADLDEDDGEPTISDLMLELGHFTAKEKVQIKVGVENENLFLPSVPAVS